MKDILSWHERLIRKLQEHSSLSRTDIAALRSLPFKIRNLSPNEDLIRQGDRPSESAVVLEGMLARYHTLGGGRRQYLSFNRAGDMPDSQGLFLDVMDHSVCAIGRAQVATVPHAAILNLFEQRPGTGFAIWKETLIDAAIFREAITNNSARPPETRLAHFFCEQYYRCERSGLTKGRSCSLPLTQTQLGETLASSLPSISRTLIKLRKTKTMEFQKGILEIKDWVRLTKMGEFDPSYLHLKRPVKVK